MNRHDEHLITKAKICRAISLYRSHIINFDEVRGWIIPYAGDLEQEYGYEHSDLQRDLDNWFEYIKYCYDLADQRDLTLSLLDFIKNIIKTETKPIVLPKNDRVITEHFK